MENTKTIPNQDNFKTEEEFFEACKQYRSMNIKTAEDELSLRIEA